MRCLQLVGSGGFAEVYLYERDQPRIKVAVKLIKTEVLDEAKRRQFAAEADVMAELTEHPFIVPVLGAGTAPDGRPYLVMRYYPSSDLAARVAREPMSVRDALRYGVQLACAVETAHRAGIIHRDIKPSNVLVSSYGQPGLSDFGIAGRPNDATEDDDEVGVSIPWSPPEVLTGASNGSVASDVYSLAATVWTLLVGRAPFTIPGGDNGDRASFTRIVHSKPPLTGRDDVPASLDRLLQQSLSKDPAHRPQSALELARHFQRVEQEMRLSRTDIVLLDHVPELPAPVAAPAAGATISRASAPAAPDPDRTIRKMPTPVGPVQGRVSAPAEPDRAAAAPPRLKPMASPLTTEQTARRPPSPENVHALTPEPAPARRRSFLVAVGAVGAAAVLAAVVLVLTHGSAPVDQSAGHNTGVTKTPVPDVRVKDVVGGGAAAPAAPTRVRGQARGASVRFDWPRVPGATSYLYRVDGAAQGIPTVQPYATVPRAAAGRTCITVQSVAPGTALNPATRGCVS